MVRALLPVPACAEPAPESGGPSGRVPVGASADRPFDAGDHALTRFVTGDAVAAAAEALTPRVTRALLREVAALVPDEWLVDEPGFDTPDDVREAYVDVLAGRAETITGRIVLSGPPKKPDAPPEWLRTWVEGKAK